jgi:hypothetical protein
LAYETPFLASKAGGADTSDPNSQEVRLFPFLTTCLPDFTILGWGTTTGGSIFISLAFETADGSI